MIAFANDPDPIFRAILDAALQWTRDELYPYVDSYQASAEEIRQLDEDYEDSQLSRFFSRGEALAQTDRLITALQDSNHYRVTDYHWLILYVALETFCDLHNDGEFGDSVGPYTIDHIDFGSMIDQFFFDTDFLFGRELRIAQERRIDAVPGLTSQAQKIAAGLKPDPEDLEIVPVSDEDSEAGAVLQPSGRPYPTSGYIGPYPLREPKDADE